MHIFLGFYLNGSYKKLFWYEDYVSTELLHTISYVVKHNTRILKK